MAPSKGRQKDERTQRVARLGASTIRDKCEVNQERWGTAKEYASYYKLLLTNSGRKEFWWWLEKEKPDLARLVKRELKIDAR